MKIYLDAMGGDNAPLAPVEGAKEALGMYPDLQIELAGPIETVQKTVDEVFGADAALRSRLTLTDCPERLVPAARNVRGTLHWAAASTMRTISPSFLARTTICGTRR